MPKVSAAHKEQVRQRLLDAARTVVLRDGHEGATTRAILDEADLSAGALYSYFASKEELFEALIEREFSDGLIDLEAGGSAALLSFARESLTVADLPALVWFRGRMSADADVQGTQRRLNRWIVETFAPLVKNAQAEGTIRSDIDHEALAELFDVLIDALNRREVLGTYVTSFERVGGLAAHLLTRSVLEGETQ